MHCSRIHFAHLDLSVITQRDGSNLRLLWSMYNIITGSSNSAVINDKVKEFFTCIYIVQAQLSTSC